MNSAFVVPTPEDYRALHTSLLEDFYGELIYQYSFMYDTTCPMVVAVDDAQINSLTDLKTAIALMRSDWASFQGFMAGGLLQRQLHSQRVYTAGPFQMQRFITSLQPKEENVSTPMGKVFQCHILVRNQFLVP